jgi:Helitron helicase-like domain at N-terminus/PIF1-like helicase
MYLLYDVIQRRKAALGNSMFVKRGDYEHVQAIITSLTRDQLLAAARSLRSTQTTADPAIRVLRQAIQTVAAKVPNSFARKQDMRLYIRAFFVEFGPAAFWLTLNPSDMRDPLVIKLAGMTFSSDVFSKSTAALRGKAAIMNPAAIAVFFDKVCTAILEGLIKPVDGEMGILGEVSTYFGVVETNGRGMLHLHALIWLAGNIEFFDLRQKLLGDPDFAQRMTEYLDAIISECIATVEKDGVAEPASLPSTSQFDTDEAYVDALWTYGNAVASKRQLHSRNHNSTCFKYSKKGTRACRFQFPRPKVDHTQIDELGVAHLRRNNEWVAPFNPCIASAIGSNMDLSFLSTRAKALSLMFYITNYSTKDENSTYQMVMAASVIKESLERAKSAATATNKEKQTMESDMLNFSLRVFNRMALDREVSGVQVASSLLKLPDYYAPPSELRRINMHYLRRRFEALIQRSKGDNDITEERVAVTSAARAKTSIFDDYKYRGPALQPLCLYEYVKLVRKRPAEDLTESDLHFDSKHPEHGLMTQIICGKDSKRITVALVGQLSPYQDAEDGMPGGHLETQAMRNDLAGVLLPLFVPWENLPALFHDVMDICDDGCSAGCDGTTHTGFQASAAAWSRVKDFLPEHVRNYARNVELLRKIKEDAKVDLAEQTATEKAMREAVDSDVDVDDDNVEADDGMLNASAKTKMNIDDDTLRLSYEVIKRRWRNDDDTIAAKIPALQLPWAPTADLSMRTFTPVVPHPTSGIRWNTSADTLKLWSNFIDSSRRSTSTSDSYAIPVNNDDDDDSNADTSDDDWDSDADNEYAILEPTLTFSETTTEPIPANLRTLANQDPSPSQISDLVSRLLPLNWKQKRTVSMVFYHALRLQGKQAAEKHEQFLLYVGGEGGTGKSRIIDAVRLGMGLLGRDREVFVAAYTGNAAKNVEGSTIHTGFNLAVRKKKNQLPPTELSEVSPRVMALWANKTILIIDEVSMVSSKLMDSIDKRCRIVKNLDPNSTAVFGGLHIVIVLGDFHQFSPVRARSLWQPQQGGNEKRGQSLWHMFSNVVLLDEQMRQQDDIAYHDFLSRTRNGTVSQSDVDMLNSRVIGELEVRPDRTNTCIVRRNKLRHQINRLQIERFARIRGQQVFIFPAHHARWTKAGKAVRNINIDKLLEVQDDSKVKGPGLLLFTKGMPAAILRNISTPLGIVNGAQGTAVEAVPDPNGMSATGPLRITLKSHANN